MALSVIGAPVLGEVFSPSISRQDASFCYSPRPFPCYRLPRERFSPPALSCPYSGDYRMGENARLSDLRVVPRIRPPGPPTTVKFGTSLRRTGALHDVECRDRPPQTF